MKRLYRQHMHEGANWTAYQNRLISFILPRRGKLSCAYKVSTEQQNGIIEIIRRCFAYVLCIIKDLFCN